MNSEDLDYIKFDETKKSRPILSIYELSSILTTLSKKIYNSNSLEEYISKDSTVNGVVNPSDIAVNVLFNGDYDALINRYSEKVLYSDMYVKPSYKEILINYYNKQRKILDNEINDYYKDE
jgi:hypothetical protein